mmetsp:Transcript_39046/g.97374  ORF Transcript_39046/g.97374 Transcript_39046/m.97374 type:complete len:213 (-) Transcript_39046:134-772(-)
MEPHRHEWHGAHHTWRIHQHIGHWRPGCATNTDAAIHRIDSIHACQQRKINMRCTACRPLGTSSPRCINVTLCVLRAGAALHAHAPRVEKRGERWRAGQAGGSRVPALLAPLACAARAPAPTRACAPSPARYRDRPNAIAASPAFPPGDRRRRASGAARQSPTRRQRRPAVFFGCCCCCVFLLLCGCVMPMTLSPPRPPRSSPRCCCVNAAS